VRRNLDQEAGCPCHPRKDADPEIPILKEAKEEYAKLK
jgi:hypothetical protein